MVSKVMVAGSLVQQLMRKADPIAIEPVRDAIRVTRR